MIRAGETKRIVELQKETYSEKGGIVFGRDVCFPHFHCEWEKKRDGDGYLERGNRLWKSGVYDNGFKVSLQKKNLLFKED